MRVRGCVNWRCGLIRGSATKQFIGRRGRYAGVTYPESIVYSLARISFDSGCGFIIVFLSNERAKVLVTKCYGYYLFKNILK
jgi:hypothetical protein